MNILQGKRALVTGASRGIGRGIALALAKAGAEVFVHYRSDLQEAQALLSEIRALGGTPQAFQADLASVEGVGELFDEIARVWGSLDIAVNNAGWDPGYVPLENITPELYHQLTDVNVRGTLLCCLREIMFLRTNPQGGCIINIGSVQQETTVPGRALYAMSKGAIHSLTGQLALECGPYGIRINNVAPGYIEVPRMSAQPGYCRTSVAQDIPLGRVGTVDDVGSFVVYLASDGAGFITGQTLVIDGGMSRKLARSLPLSGFSTVPEAQSCTCR